MTKSVLLALVFVASPAFGLIYSWTDPQGVAHYTNKEYEIPPRYRARAKALYPEQADSAPAQQAKPEGSPTPPQARPEEPQRPAQTEVIRNQNNIEAEPVRVRKRHRRASSPGDE